MLQATLDLPSVQRYLVPSFCAQAPLRIVKNEPLQDQPELVKFEHPVEYVAPLVRDGSRPRGVPAIEFTNVTLSRDAAFIEFRFDAEGLLVTAQFARIAEGWHLERDVVRMH